MTIMMMMMMIMMLTKLRQGNVKNKSSWALKDSYRDTHFVKGRAEEAQSAAMFAEKYGSEQVRKARTMT